MLKFSIYSVDSPVNKDLSWILKVPNHGDSMALKGALDNFSLIARFFFKVEIFIPLEVYAYLVTACLILLATST